MSDSNLLSYVGAVTGIAGAVMGYIGLRRSGQMKALDLRLQLRKDVSTLRSTIEGLGPLQQRAEQSRSAVFAATGLFQSGAMEQWKAELAKDAERIAGLVASIPDAGATFEDLTPSGLEAKIVEVHGLQTNATQLVEKYRAGLATDDCDREQIRAAAQRR